MAKGNNIDYRKWHKKNLILQIIRSNPNPSRSSVKEMSGLSMESVLQYIDELLQENLIVQAGISASAVGRKATMLQINPFGAYFIGIKFNAIQLTGIVMDFGGDIIRQKQIDFPTQVEVQTVIDAVLVCIQDLLDSLSVEKNKVKGIGIGVPGYVDSASGIASLYVHIRNWKDIPLRKIVEDRFGLRTYIEQSVKVTALALKLDPENQNIRDMLYILVGRGVGMVIIANNEICSGHNNGAGEIGHVFVTDNGQLCECGKLGCLETEAGQNVILKKLTAGLHAGRHPVLRVLLKDNKAPTVGDFVQSIELGDPDSVQLMQQLCLYLGRAVANAVTLLSPHKIIFSGEITRAPGFIDAIRAEIETRCPANSIKSMVLQARNNEDSFNARGAAMLAYSSQYGTGDGTGNRADPSRV